MPDGTSLIFDSKAFKLGEFSTVLARWHDLSEKDTERIVWFAASGGPWTIRAATILVPLRVARPNGDFDRNPVRPNMKPRPKGREIILHSTFA